MSGINSSVFASMIKEVGLVDQEIDMNAKSQEIASVRALLTGYGVPSHMADHISNHLIMCGQVIGNRQAQERDFRGRVKALNIIAERIAHLNQAGNLEAILEKA